MSSTETFCGTFRIHLLNFFFSLALKMMMVIYLQYIYIATIHTIIISFQHLFFFFVLLVFFPYTFKVKSYNIKLSHRGHKKKKNQKKKQKRQRINFSHLNIYLSQSTHQKYFHFIYRYILSSLPDVLYFRFRLCVAAVNTNIKDENSVETSKYISLYELRTYIYIYILYMYIFM